MIGQERSVLTNGKMLGGGTDKKHTMNEEERENLKRLVNELDESIPRDGAAVKMFVYGGAPDESRMVGNEIGYLRLGVEFLKGTLQALQVKDTDTCSLDIDLEYLETSASDIYFSDFTIDEKLRVEFVMPALSRWQKIKDKISEVAVAALVLFLFGSFVTGVATIVLWIVHLFKSIL